MRATHSLAKGPGFYRMEPIPLPTSRPPSKSTTFSGSSDPMRTRFLSACTVARRENGSRRKFNSNRLPNSVTWRWTQTHRWKNPRLCPSSSPTWSHSFSHNPSRSVCRHQTLLETSDSATPHSTFSLAVRETRRCLGSMASTCWSTEALVGKLVSGISHATSTGWMQS